MNIPIRPRILFVWEAHPGPYEYIFSKFSAGFERIGCELRILELDLLTFEAYRKSVANFNPDIIFGLLRHSWAIFKFSQFLEEFHPAIVLNWFQEDPNFISKEILDSSKNFDYWFTQDPRTVPFWPTKAFFSPHAFDETVYFNKKMERKFDVSFVGQLGHELSTDMLWPYLQEFTQYYRRALVGIERPLGIPIMPAKFERFLRSKKLRPFLQLLFYLNSTWENPVDEVQKSNLISMSKIHFGLNRVRGLWEPSVKAILPDYKFDQHGLFCQTKGRLFHAVGCGALALCDYVPELELLFNIKTEIVTFEFNDFNDYREKLKWYIEHDSAREKIAKAGYERGHRDHTYVARIKQIFQLIREN